MGCSSSHTDSSAAPDRRASREPVAAAATVPARTGVAAAHQRTHCPPSTSKRFQVKLADEWKGDPRGENSTTIRAFWGGHQNCHCSHKGEKYECIFSEKVTQVKLDTSTELDIRQRPPKTALLSGRRLIDITVQKGQPGKMILVDDPSHPGQKIQVPVPSIARVGSKLAILVPDGVVEEGRGIGNTAQSVTDWR